MISRQFSSVLKPAIKKQGRKSTKLMDKRPLVQDQRARNAALDRQAAEKKLDWRIMASTILHRYPIITRDLEPWEKDYNDFKELEYTMRRQIIVDETADAPIIPEKEPSYEEIIESMPFTPASRISEADKTNDRHSMDRRYQDSLYFIVKRNRAGDHSWQFPQSKIDLPTRPFVGKQILLSDLDKSEEEDNGQDVNNNNNDEDEEDNDEKGEEGTERYERSQTMVTIEQEGQEQDGENFRTASERVIDRAVGTIDRYFFTNAPVGHYCYAYPSLLQEKRSQFGAKIFYQRCQYLDGNIILNTKLYKDYAWIARDEVGEYFDAETAKYLTHLLPM